MDNEQFVLILAAVWIAPNLPPVVSFTAGAIMFVIAVVISIRGGKP